MERPTSIKIFGQKYKIRYDYKPADSFGLCDQANNNIHIRHNLPADKLVRVLLHEITHAIIFETPMSMRKRFDVEEVCDIVGYHVLDTLQHNPKVLAFLMRDINETKDS